LTKPTEHYAEAGTVFATDEWPEKGFPWKTYTRDLLKAQARLENWPRNVVHPGMYAKKGIKSFSFEEVANLVRAFWSGKIKWINSCGLYFI
jgi:hypothetical protein